MEQESADKWGWNRPEADSSKNESLGWEWGQGYILVQELTTMQ